MRSLIHAWIDIKLSNASNQQEVTDEILQEHQGILEAVLARDAIIAAERMSEHLMNAARRLEAAIGADYCLTEDVFALLVPRTRSD
jgi:DNA-binding FadR family transcriptional regulator